VIRLSFLGFVYRQGDLGRPGSPRPSGARISLIGRRYYIFSRGEVKRLGQALNPQKDLLLIKEIEGQPLEGDDPGQKDETVPAARDPVQPAEKEPARGLEIDHPAAEVDGDRVQADDPEEKRPFPEPPDAP